MRVATGGGTDVGTQPAGRLGEAGGAPGAGRWERGTIISRAVAEVDMTVRAAVAAVIFADGGGGGRGGAGGSPLRR